MKLMKIILAAIMLLVLTASAQTTRQLTLDQAIQLAIDNNPLVKAKAADVKSAESKMDAGTILRSPRG